MENRNRIFRIAGEGEVEMGGGGEDGRGGRGDRERGEVEKMGEVGEVSGWVEVWSRKETPIKF